MIYGLREALRIAVGDEWLPTSWERHRRAHHALRDALALLGCERLAPDGVDEAAVRRALLLEHGIEISGGLGPLTGRLWRVGVMGAGARREPQEQLVGALATLLHADPAEPLAALAEGWRA